MFDNANNLTINANDLPNLVNVTNAVGLFTDATVNDTNNNIGKWNVNNIEDMSEMFVNSTITGTDLSQWNTISSRRMDEMFRGANTFNADISGWNVSNVTAMNEMFINATAFSQDLSEWNTENVTQCENFSFDSGLSDEQHPTLGCFTSYSTTEEETPTDDTII